VIRRAYAGWLHRRSLHYLHGFRQGTAYLVEHSRFRNVDEHTIQRGRHAAWKTLVQERRAIRRQIREHSDDRALSEMLPWMVLGSLVLMAIGVVAAWRVL